MCLPVNQVGTFTYSKCSDVNMQYMEMQQSAPKLQI